MARISLSVINDLVSDQRVHRIASALQAQGHQVSLIGRLLPTSPSLSDRPYQTRRMKLRFTHGKLFYLEYNWRLFWVLLRSKNEIMVANDLDTLLANYLASKLKGARLVYDTHEYFTEVPELINRPRNRNIWLRLEQWLFPKLKTAYTVNTSIAEIYKEKYGVDVQVIRNVPFRQQPNLSSSKENILIYQGALNLGRGIQLMIDAMEFLPDCVLWIFGGGDLEQDLRAHASTKAWKSRVVFHGRYPFEQLFEWTCQAKLGFSLEEDLGANYHFASPNKVYDYIQAGVPVLVSDLPEMRRTAETYGVGEVLEDEERSPEKLAKRIAGMLANKEKYQGYVQNCIQAGSELNWEKEKKKLLALYEEV
jgi:glycosyltransferase involved in cell wall biosynthesis